MSEITYKSKLYTVIREAYKHDQRVEDYLKFRVQYIKKALKSKGASYNTQTRTIEMLLNGENYEDLLLSVLIHEATHHVQYMMEGKTDHSSNFRAIQKKLLFKAMDLKYINAFKLRAYYKYLSSYTEAGKVLGMIEEYVKGKEQDCFFIGYIIPYDKNEIAKLKEAGYKYCKHGVRGLSNIWYKF
ncbi:MAG: SprT-like domain-containing protein, partial [Solobacterium sp.]|nr:SprT-like domain-containing protein [Solobacterium sp.]